VRSDLEYPFSVRLGNALLAYTRYLGKAVWPSHLAAMYPHPGESLQAWQAVAAALLLGFISAGVWQHGDGDICWWAGCGFWALWFP